MTASRAHRIAVTCAVVVVGLAVAAGAFAGVRQARVGALSVPGSPAPSASRTPSASPTPSAVASATASPSAPSSAPSGSAAAPVPAAGVLAASLVPALRAAALGPSVRADVVDAVTGQTLFTADPSTPAKPASTTKLVTGAATLAVHDPSDRFVTRVVAGTVPGQIVLVGGGDPTLSAAAAGRPTLYRGAARLSDLAAAVRRVVPGAITSIVVDDGLFTGSLLAPGWEPEDVPSDYQSGVTATMVDGGLPAGGGTIRVARPDLEAGRALANLLGVPGASVSTGTAVAGSRVLGSVRSAPVTDLVEQMMKLSDDVIAEVLLRQVAVARHVPASFAGGALAARQALAAYGVTVPATLSDGSGVSQNDRLSPAFLTGLVRTILRTPKLAPLITALPVAGWDGTLGPRYRAAGSAGAAGAVRAKTGSLSGVVTLSGVAHDRDGRLLVFAFMTDRVPDGGIEAAEAALDVAANRLVACGCR